MVSAVGGTELDVARRVYIQIKFRLVCSSILSVLLYERSTWKVTPTATPRLRSSLTSVCHASSEYARLILVPKKNLAWHPYKTKVAVNRPHIKEGRQLYQDGQRLSSAEQYREPLMLKYILAENKMGKIQK